MDISNNLIRWFCCDLSASGASQGSIAGTLSHNGTWPKKRGVGNVGMPRASSKHQLVHMLLCR